jgi:cell division protein FtsI (penicillin-binding protein 3)
LYDLKGKGRLVVFLIIVVCLTLVLLGRYVYLMLFLPGQESEEALEPPTVERGPILDRHGKILAITTTLDSVSAWIPALENLEQTVEILEEVLDIDREAVLKTLTTKDGFAFIKRKITPTESSRISTLMADGKLPGIKLEPEYGRNYPLRNSAAHLVGYVSLDNNGLDGIEWSYQSQLSPASLGRDIDYIYGNQVFLTIDANVQHFMEKIGVEAMI